MPKCLKCNNLFSTWQEIDGKRRNLRNRKYCLDCSPFGKGNTRRLHLSSGEVQGSPCTCTICGRSYIYARKKGGTTKKCGSCLTNIRRFDKKRKAVEYKGGKCFLCGYDRCINALSFHHIDNGKTKAFTISGRHSMRWDITQKELDKCILLCMNCHVEVHAGVRTIPLCKTTMPGSIPAGL